MKKIMKLISLICVISLLAGCSLVSKVEEEPKKEPSVTVVTVDGVEYNLERFNLYYYSAQDEILAGAGYTQSTDIPDDFWKQKVDGKTNLQRAKDKALSDLINDALKYQKAKELGIELTADEKSYISTQMSSLKQDKMTLEQFKNIGISEKEYEKFITENFHMEYLVPELIKKGELKADEDAAVKELNNSYVKAKHILISAQQSPSDSKSKDAEKKAQDILAKINAGEDFDTLMQENNEDPGMASAPDGYVFTTGEMVPEFEEAAFALAEGQVSGLVQSDYGYHIIKRVPFDLEGEQETTALETIKSNIAAPEVEELLKVWKEKAKIEIEYKIISDLKPTIVKN